MVLFKGLDDPIVGYTESLPYAASAGICSVCDPRGVPDATGKLYAYDLIPTSAVAFVIQRRDLGSKAAGLLAAPPVAAAGAYNTSLMAAYYDPNGGAASDRPKVYVAVGCTGGNHIQWMSFDVNTLLWDAVLTTPTIAADLATSVAICHPCNTLGGGYWATLDAHIAEDYLYLLGNGGTWNGGAVSKIAQYSKIGNSWIYLTGAAGVRGGAPAAGSKAIWLPGYPNRIWSNRGGASEIIDYYLFSTNAWTAIAAPSPARILNAGTEMQMVYGTGHLIAVRPSDQPKEILGLDVSLATPVYRAICALEGDNGTVHESNGLLSWQVAGCQFFGITPHGSTGPQKIQVPLPL